MALASASAKRSLGGSGKPRRRFRGGLSEFSSASEPELDSTRRRVAPRLGWRLAGGGSLLSWSWSWSSSSVSSSDTVVRLFAFFFDLDVDLP